MSKYYIFQYILIIFSHLQLLFTSTTLLISFPLITWASEPLKKQKMHSRALSCVYYFPGKMLRGLRTQELLIANSPQAQPNTPEHPPLQSF